jgi:hypothetical protein
MGAMVAGTKSLRLLRRLALQENGMVKGVFKMPQL